MKVTRQKAAENRERVLAVAGQLFREKGFESIGIADLMKHAGLTHGAFYGQFKSKEDLAVRACQAVMARAVSKHTNLATESARPLATFLINYLSEQARDARGTGCPIAGLGPEMARQSPPVRQAFTQGFEDFIGALSKTAPGRTKAAKRHNALVIMSQLVGALMLSRALTDPALSKEILDSALADLQTKTPKEN